MDFKIIWHSCGPCGVGDLKHLFRYVEGQGHTGRSDNKMMVIG